MKKQKGFTLIELAMVLFIIGLMLGGLLVPLTKQMETKQRNQALEQLNEIREALIGYAIINGRLPCYTTQTDPANAAYGEEDTACAPAVLAFDSDGDGENDDGILPWKTLGLANGLDPWGIQRTTATDPWIGYWRYRVDTTFESDTRFALTDQPGEMTICDSSNALLIATTERPVVVIYSTGANQAADGQNASYEATLTATSTCTPAPTGPTYQSGVVSGAFDDLTVWITRPLLFNRLVTAGRLP